MRSDPDITDKLWTYISARDPEAPLQVGMKHKDLWMEMEVRVHAAGNRHEHLKVRNDQVVWAEC
eukprot:1910923-Alexandrium_andersonii.AAC.1